MAPSPRVRTALRRLGATTSAVVVLAATAAVVGAGYFRPTPAPTPIEPAVVSVGAGVLNVVCSGPPRLTTDANGGDIDYDDEFGPSPQGVAVLTEALTLGRDGAEPGASTLGSLGSADTSSLSVNSGVGFASVPEVTAPSVLSAEPVADVAALAAGATVARADSGDLRGLAAAPCQVPESTVWLVGGTTELGSGARLTLTNPGRTPVTATVDLWGATGPIDADTQVLVPPGEARVVLLETLSLEPRLAVRVASEGGRVAAQIQDSTLRGVVPAGTDFVGAAASPATDLLVGPVPLLASTASEAEPALLRLVNPNPEPATVAVSLLGERGGQPLPGAEELVLEPGTVVDISLAGVPAGSTTVRIASDLPVTGAVRLSRLGEAGELDPDEPVLDQAWLAAAEPVAHGVLALAGNGSLVEASALAVTNPESAAQDVTLLPLTADGPGEPVTISVPAATTAVVTDQVDLGSAVGVEITANGLLASNALTAAAPDGELIAMLPMTPDADREQAVTVRLGAS